eukprot:m.38673 g.38673  ORF g.38673 m.38673 type:complete len:869 (-) comp5520_c0_seq1:247-2853(-)
MQFLHRLFTGISKPPEDLQTADESRSPGRMTLAESRGPESSENEGDGLDGSFDPLRKQRSTLAALSGRPDGTMLARGGLAQSSSSEIDAVMALSSIGSTAHAGGPPQNPAGPPHAASARRIPTMRPAHMPDRNRSAAASRGSQLSEPSVEQPSPSSIDARNAASNGTDRRAAAAATTALLTLPSPVDHRSGNSNPGTASLPARAATASSPAGLSASSAAAWNRTSSHFAAVTYAPPSMATWSGQPLLGTAPAASPAPGSYKDATSMHGLADPHAILHPTSKPAAPRSIPVSSVGTSSAALHAAFSAQTSQGPMHPHGPQAISLSSAVFPENMPLPTSPHPGFALPAASPAWSSPSAAGTSTAMPASVDGAVGPGSSPNASFNALFGAHATHSLQHAPSVPHSAPPAKKQLSLQKHKAAHAQPIAPAPPLSLGYSSASLLPGSPAYSSASALRAPLHAGVSAWPSSHASLRPGFGGLHPPLMAAGVPPSAWANFIRSGMARGPGVIGTTASMHMPYYGFSPSTVLPSGPHSRPPLAGVHSCPDGRKLPAPKKKKAAAPPEQPSPSKRPRVAGERIPPTTVHVPVTRRWYESGVAPFRETAHQKAVVVPHWAPVHPLNADGMPELPEKILAEERRPPRPEDLSDARYHRRHVGLEGSERRQRKGPAQTAPSTASYETSALKKAGTTEESEEQLLTFFPTYTQASECNGIVLNFGDIYPLMAFGVSVPVVSQQDYDLPDEIKNYVPGATPSDEPLKSKRIKKTLSAPATLGGVPGLRKSASARPQKIKRLMKAIHRARLQAAGAFAGGPGLGSSADGGLGAAVGDVIDGASPLTGPAASQVSDIVEDFPPEVIDDTVELITIEDDESAVRA